YRHRTNLIQYTVGVKHLAERLSARWLIDLIAIAQPVARRDEWLVIFQLWEVLTRGRDRSCLVACSRGEGEPVFTTCLASRPLPIEYVRLYVQRGMLRLPRER